MAPSNPSKRIRNISVSRPIIYGNTAEKICETNPLPANAPSENSHTWKVFVADPLGNDLSHYIKKVVFKLHDTYTNPTRSIESPPFEVKESGWGEFEIVIKIYFNSDCGEKNLTLYHHLKLHPYPSVQGSSPDDVVPDVTGKVESILYDEIVFNEPTEKMFKLLTQKPGSLLPYKSNTSDFTKYNERQEIERIDEALGKIAEQLEKRQVAFKALDEERKEIVQL